MKIDEALDLLNNNGYIVESLNGIPYDQLFMRIHNYMVAHNVPGLTKFTKDNEANNNVDEFIRWLLYNDILRNREPDDSLVLFSKDELYKVIPEKDFNAILKSAHWYNCTTKEDDSYGKVVLRRGDEHSTNANNYIVNGMPFLHLSYADDAVLKACGLRPRCKSYFEKYPPRIYLMDLNKIFTQALVAIARQDPFDAIVVAHDLTSTKQEVKNHAIDFMLHAVSHKIKDMRDQLAHFAVMNGTEYTTKDGQHHEVQKSDYHAYLITINDNTAIYKDPAFGDGVYVTNKIHPKNITRVSSDVIGF